MQPVSSKPTLTTFTGKEIFPWDLTNDQICIEDIAHHLSNICRFAGAVKQFYSVAQHCIEVSRMLTGYGPRLELMGLLHDAAEAYWIDLPTPIKHHSDLNWYANEEWRCEKTILKRFGLIPTDVDHHLIKNADNWSYDNERLTLLPPYQGTYLVPMSPSDAERIYLERFSKLFLEVFDATRAYD